MTTLNIHTFMRKRYLALIMCVFPFLSQSAEVKIDPMEVAANLVTSGSDVAGAFMAAFPDAQTFVSHYNMPEAGQWWHGKALINNRFILSINIPINISKNANGDPGRVELIGASNKMVYEVTNINVEKRSVIFGRQIKPSDDQWNSIMKTKSVDAIWPHASTLDPAPGYEKLSEWLAGL